MEWNDVDIFKICIDTACPTVLPSPSSSWSSSWVVPFGCLDLSPAFCHKMERKGILHSTVQYDVFVGLTVKGKWRISLSM